jgi:hypothetical protein
MQQLGNIENNMIIFHYRSRLRDFWYEAQKKAKTNARDNDFQGWNDVAVWKDFKQLYIPRDIWLQYVEHMISDQFTRRS